MRNADINAYIRMYAHKKGRLRICFRNIRICEKCVITLVGKLYWLVRWFVIISYKAVSYTSMFQSEHFL